MKPLLAATPKGDDLENLNYPVWVSSKLDGIRCLIVDGQAVTRTLKPISNDYIRDILSDMQLDGLDGEIIVGSPIAPDCYNVTQSGVMSKQGMPSFTYHVFDLHNMAKETHFSQRFLALRSSPYLTIVPHQLVTNHQRLLEVENKALSAGYEGIMVRDPQGIYKHGRSTVKQGILLKVKRFMDGEAHVTGYQELMSNQNTLEQDELGHAKRSSAKAGQVGANTLGAIDVQDVKTGIQFSIGSGFSAKERADLWADRGNLIGRLVKYKYFPVGNKDKPRFPTFLGWRDPRDLV